MPFYFENVKLTHIADCAKLIKVKCFYKNCIYNLIKSYVHIILLNRALFHKIINIIYRL